MTLTDIGINGVTLSGLGLSGITISGIGTAAFSQEDALWAYLYLFGAGVLATGIWRALGVVLSNGLSVDSQIMIWVRYVSTALVAGLVAKMVLFPTGALAQVELWMRMAAFALGFTTFLITGRLFWGLSLGVLLLIAALYGIGLRP